MVTSISLLPFQPAKHLRLGDVILAVNGRSLQGASHSEAVTRLKQAGPTVLLRIRPNQVLEGEAALIEIEGYVLCIIESTLMYIECTHTLSLRNICGFMMEYSL